MLPLTIKMNNMYNTFYTKRVGHQKETKQRVQKTYFA
jgi:hypothetical protein